MYFSFCTVQTAVSFIDYAQLTYIFNPLSSANSTWQCKCCSWICIRNPPQSFHSQTRWALGAAHVPPTKVFRRLTGSLNKTIVKPRVAAAANTYTLDFPRRKIPRISAYTIAEKAIRFWHPDYNPDRAQKSTVSSSMSRHLSTCNISSKSMHAFLCNLANRQTDGQMRANAFTPSFVGDNYITVLNVHKCKEEQPCIVAQISSLNCLCIIVFSKSH